MILTSWWKWALPLTLLIVLAICKEHHVERIQRNIIVNMVGITPDLWKTEGRLSIAGPVNELTAMAMDPSIPMVPVKYIISILFQLHIPFEKLKRLSPLWSDRLACEPDLSRPSPFSSSLDIGFPMINGVFSFTGADIFESKAKFLSLETIVDSVS